MTFHYKLFTPEAGDRPFRAFVYIVPKSFSSGEDGWPLLSPQITEPEIDGYIQSYKEDLDRVGRLAKRALRRANKRTRDMISATPDERK